MSGRWKHHRHRKRVMPALLGYGHATSDSLLALSVATISCSEDPPAVPSWDLDVYPILRGNCGHCHGVTAKFDPGLRPKPDTTSATRSRSTLLCHRETLDTGFNEPMRRPTWPAPAPAPACWPRTPRRTSFRPCACRPRRPTLCRTTSRPSCKDGSTRAGPAVPNRAPNRKPEMKIISAAAAVPGSQQGGVTIEVTDPDGDQAFGYAKIGNAAPQVIPGAVRPLPVRVRRRTRH